VSRLYVDVARVLPDDVSDVTKDVTPIGAHLENLPCDQSATASEIARALYGATHSLEQIMEIVRASEIACIDAGPDPGC
jgi:hypothetical protein